MRITLLKYISKEIWSIFLTCLLVFLFVVMASQMLNKTDLIISNGAGLVEFFSIIFCLIPQFILYSLPAACLMAVLLSFIRMASDNEIIALHSSGISLYQLMPPVVIFSFICFIFAGFLTLFWAPYGNRTYESLKFTIIQNSIDEARLKEGVFEELGDLVFFVNSYYPKSEMMKDVFCVYKDEGKEITVVAKKARFIREKNKFYIEIADYKIITDSKNGDTIITVPKLPQAPYKLPIPIDKMVKISKNDEIEPEDMYLDELLGVINNPEEGVKRKNIAKLTLYEMFSLPMAVLLIGIAGAPLGAQIRANGRTKGIIISLLLFLVYFIILISVRGMCENGTINPAVGVLLPVIFLAIISVFLLILAKGNLSINIFKILQPANTPQKT